MTEWNNFLNKYKKLFLNYFFNLNNKDINTS
jgi:hypothetical protein